MNEIFAIDPEAPEDLKDIKAMFEKFGLSNGRFIADFPEGWLLSLRDHAQRLQGLDRSRLFRLIEIHKDALLRVNLDFSRTKTWGENVSGARFPRQKISKILGTDPNPLGLETLQKFLWDDESGNASRGSHIAMNPDAYRIAVAPLFQHSTEIHLVDPFFHLRRENGDTDRNRESILREILLEAEISQRCELIKIHFKYLGSIHKNKKAQELIIESDLEYLCAELNLKSLMIEFDVSDDVGHGRYIFGLKGGLQFDHGFDCKRDKTNHVHWLSRAELDPIIKRFSNYRVM